MWTVKHEDGVYNNKVNIANPNSGLITMLAGSYIPEVNYREGHRVQHFDIFVYNFALHFLQFASKHRLSWLFQLTKANFCRGLAKNSMWNTSIVWVMFFFF